MDDETLLGLEAKPKRSLESIALACAGAAWWNQQMRWTFR